MKRFILLLATALLLLGVQCKVMLSMYSDQSTTFYKCLKQQGFQTVILQVDSDVDGPKKSNIQNLFNAKNAGLQVQFGYVPCRSHSAAQEVQQLLKQTGRDYFKKVWLGPQHSHPGCSWTDYDAKQNCQHLQQVINLFKGSGITAGVGTSRDSWPTVFGTVDGCPEVGFTPLWWFPVGDENDGIPSFAKYHQIGGWKTPSMKAYNTFAVCGATGVISYYE